MGVPTPITEFTDAPEKAPHENIVVPSFINAGFLLNHVTSYSTTYTLRVNTLQFITIEMELWNLVPYRVTLYRKSWDTIVRTHRAHTKEEALAAATRFALAVQMGLPVE